MDHNHRHHLFVSSDGSAESGWTLYLEHSFPSANASFDVQKAINGSREEEEEEEEEEEDEELDLSMVSDASSGPQTFRENEVGFPENESGYSCNKTAGRLAKSSRKMKGSEERRRRDQQEPSSFLDDTDTASSHSFNFNPEKSTYQSQFNSLRQSSISGNQNHNNKWFKGKRSAGLR